jgi:hypothetical protein
MGRMLLWARRMRRHLQINTLQYGFGIDIVGKSFSMRRQLHGMCGMQHVTSSHGLFQGQVQHISDAGRYKTPQLPSRAAKLRTISIKQDLNPEMLNFVARRILPVSKFDCR